MNRTVMLVTQKKGGIPKMAKTYEIEVVDRDDPIAQPCVFRVLAKNNDDARKKARARVKGMGHIVSVHLA